MEKNTKWLILAHAALLVAWLVLSLLTVNDYVPSADIIPGLVIIWSLPLLGLCLYHTTQYVRQKRNFVEALYPLVIPAITALFSTVIASITKTSLPIMLLSVYYLIVAVPSFVIGLLVLLIVYRLRHVRSR